MKKDIKLIIFDLDGTLVNAYAAVARSINFTMKKMGLPKRDGKLIKRSVGWGDSQLIRRFVGDELFDEAIAIYRKHHRDALKKGTRFLPGGKKILDVLRKKGYVLAVATNRPSKFTNIILRHLDMRKYFACVVCADQVGRGKPDPKMLRYVLKKFSLKPAQALYVGDMIIDAEAGRRAGLTTVAVTTGSSTRRELKEQRPYRIISRITQLEGVFDSIITKS